MGPHPDPEPASFAWAAQWFSGKRILVTGGTSGIGAAVAGGFVEANAEVCVTGLTPHEVDAAAADARLGRARRHVLDVRSPEQIDRLVGGLEGLDVVVNCAGMIRRGDELDPSVFDAVVDVNLSGSMRVSSAARPLLARSGGAIVNLASMLSFFGGGLVPGYAASKGGIAQLTKSLAIAYAPDGIRVNAIAPGWIATPLTAALREDADRSRAVLERTPLRRWGTPEDLIGAVVYLCSPVAAFVTGTILVVDGGYSIA